MATDPTDVRLQSVLRDALDRHSGPHPTWADSPARRRIDEGEDRGTLRVPLRVLGLAAVFLLGGAAVVGALVQQGPTPPPAAAATNGWIAFAANGKYGDTLQVTTDQGRSVDRDIYIVREGATPRRIAGTGQDGLAQECPTFSADGRLLVYTEVDPETIAGAETPAPQPQASDGSSPAAPPTTPDAPAGPARYAIVASRIEADGTVTEAGRITPEAEVEGCAVPSPDGRRIAYATATGDIWIASLDGTQSNVDGNLHITDLAWAPDGSAVAGLYGDGEVWIVSAQGGEGLHVPIKGTGSALHWSPDGTQLAVRTDTGLEILTRSGVRVGGFAITDPDGTGDLAWSPDGDVIAQVRGDRIALLTPHGELVRFVEPAWPDSIRAAQPDPTSMSVEWAPDGTRLMVGVRTSRPEGPSLPGGPSLRAGALVSLPLSEGAAATVLVSPTPAFSGQKLDVTCQAVYP